MMKALANILKVPELKERILFTLFMLCLCRVGGFIPVPGVDSEIALGYFRQAMGGGQNFFQMIDIFSGGAFSQMTVIALGVMPYISASIMTQLLVAIFPQFKREMQENPEMGKRKIGRLTRFITIALCVLQSTWYAHYALGMNQARPGIVSGELLQFQFMGVPILFYLLFIITMTTGTMLLMWVGEQITERGIGNGLSLIICLGIFSQLPSAVGIIIQQLNFDSQDMGQMNLATVALLIAIFTVVTLATIQLVQGHRRIPVQHARRVVGRKETQGGNSYIPLKVNYAGVLPVIFASTLLMFVATIASMSGAAGFSQKIASWFSQGSWIYMSCYVLLILFFSYFWMVTQFNPDQVASDMKRAGAFIPGVRQGKPTQDYLETSMGRITLIGAVFLALLAILPTTVQRFLGVPQNISYFFGGTALLILVGVVLDTMKQIESHLIMNRYDGFIKGKRIRGRSPL
jgi:preprotein translocase subunit SecY